VPAFPPLLLAEVPVAVVDPVRADPDAVDDDEVFPLVDPVLGEPCPDVVPEPVLPEPMVALARM